ncbi:MAG TPA: lipid A biosynthesis lauroyl acyltransferase, partial [Achromobacter sp.]|nr:lipid A biosynthesis lauroyl acyltransferase [Achromobacter sp.]
MNPQRKARLVYRATTLFARLPWPLLRGFAYALAWAWIRLNARESRVTRRNLELAYPEITGTARDRLHRELLRSTALQAIETLRLGSQKPADNLRLHLKEQHGAALYDAALASGKGVIVAAPHFGNWELLNQWLASRGQIAIVYKPPEGG